MEPNNSGGWKVCSCDDDRFVAVFKTTKGWYPAPVKLSGESEVDGKCLQKIKKKLATKGIKI